MIWRVADSVAPVLMDCPDIIESIIVFYQTQR